MIPVPSEARIWIALGRTDMRVRSGTDAQLGYLEAVCGDTTSERREAIRQALEAYCRRDTEAMMVVLQRLCCSLTNASSRS